MTVVHYRSFHWPLVSPPGKLEVRNRVSTATIKQCIFTFSQACKYTAIKLPLLTGGFMVIRATNSWIISARKSCFFKCKTLKTLSRWHVQLLNLFTPYFIYIHEAFLILLTTLLHSFLTHQTYRSSFEDMESSISRQRQWSGTAVVHWLPFWLTVFRDGLKWVGHLSQQRGEW